MRDLPLALNIVGGPEIHLQRQGLIHHWKLEINDRSEGCNVLVCGKAPYLVSEWVPDDAELVRISGNRGEQAEDVLRYELGARKDSSHIDATDDLRLLESAKENARIKLME